VYLSSRDTEYLEVDGAHDGERQEVGSASDDENVDDVELKHALVGLRPVLHGPVDRVPTGVDRREADERREQPDAGVQLPDEPYADGVVVEKRLTDGEVAVEADGEKDEDGGRTQHHVRRDVDIAERRSAERPRPVAVQRRERAHRKHAAAEQQISDGQRQQEVVGRRAQLAVGGDGDADEQVPADCDDDEQHENQSDYDRFRHAVARRQTDDVTSGLVRRDVIRRCDAASHCADVEQQQISRFGQHPFDDKSL